MATALSDILTDAYRESNLIALVASPNDNQITEGLILLNRLLMATVGSEVGGDLSDLQIGGNYDQSSFASEYIPDGARLVLNLTEDRTFKLHPLPRDGQRFAVVDGNNTLGAYNVTLDANGRKIEGAATFDIVTTDDDDQTVVDAGQWLYRADLGNWVKITDLGEDDDIPFPQEYDDYFTTRLAMRLNPRYGQSITPETKAALDDQQQKIEARYRRRREAHELPTLGLLGERRSHYGSTTAFNTGNTWR